MTVDAMRVEGLAAFRRECRRVGPDAVREFRAVVLGGAKMVATTAGELAPHGTRPIPLTRRPRKRLADSYRAGARGSSGIVRTPLLHGRIKEYRKSGTAAEMHGTRPVARAIDAREDDIVSAFASGFEHVAARRGFR